MIKVTNSISLDDDEIKESFIRSPGPGGQNVNKVETAVQIRFDAGCSPALSEAILLRLKTLAGHRMTSAGIVIITANKFRSQMRNREDAQNRLVELIRQAAVPPKNRRKTNPTRSSKIKRVETKKKQGIQKKQRQKNIALE